MNEPINTVSFKLLIRRDPEGLVIVYPCDCVRPAPVYISNNDHSYLEFIELASLTKCVVKFPCGCHIIGSFAEYLNLTRRMC